MISACMSVCCSLTVVSVRGVLLLGQVLKLGAAVDQVAGSELHEVVELGNNLASLALLFSIHVVDVDGCDGLVLGENLSRLKFQQSVDLPSQVVARVVYKQVELKTVEQARLLADGLQKLIQRSHSRLHELLAVTTLQSQIVANLLAPSLVESQLCRIQASVPAAPGGVCRSPSIFSFL